MTVLTKVLFDLEVDISSLLGEFPLLGKLGEGLRLGVVLLLELKFSGKTCVRGREREIGILVKFLL